MKLTVAVCEPERIVTFPSVCMREITVINALIGGGVVSSAVYVNRV